MTSNTILTPTIIAKEALRLLSNNLIFVNRINRGWEGEFQKEHNGYKPGSSVTIRKPARFTSVASSTLSVQNFVENNTSLSIDKPRHIGVNFSSTELTLQLNDFSERFLKSAMLQLANDIDADALSMYNQVNNVTGT